ncbi:MAG: flagellar FlbD family protein [Elusimicrobia bacterium]|nr:flagellar FlbD family protein [Elusimicrobiota bacterium]
MIQVTRLNGSPLTVNAELIETIEACPDTVLALATGNRIIVKETVEQVIAKVVEYRKKVNSDRSVPNPIQGFERKNA